MNSNTGETALSPPRLTSAAAQSAVVLLLLAAALLAFEARFHFFFLQDDNRDALLPYYTVAYRALQGGELAQINFHQALGVPLLANGQSAVLSPAPYLAMAASRALFGHEFATMDILTALYFALGGLGSIYLGRRLKLSPWSVIFAAVSWTCNPFLVYLNVGWPMAPLVAFLPWVIGASLALRERVTRGRVVLFVLAHLGLLFAGYIPWFVDAVLFEVLAHLGLSIVAWRRGSTPSEEGRSLLGIASLLALVALLGLPLLLPMGYQTTLSADRAVPLSYAEYSSNSFRLDTWSNGVLFPFARLAPRTDDNAFIDYSSPAGLAHVGYIPLVLAALAFRRWWRGRRTMVPAAVAARDPFWPVAAFLALVALLWALGILAIPIYFVPVLNRFRWPFKMLGFANFFFAWLAARALDVELSTRTRTRPAFALGALVVLLHACNLVGINLGHSFRGNLRHADSVPLSEPRAAELRGGRTFTLATPIQVGDHAHTAPMLGFDYASIFGLDAFAGYDPMMPATNARATFKLNYEAEWPGAPAELPIPYLRQWSVRWYIVPPAMEHEFAETLRAAGMTRAAADPYRVLYRDPAALALASWQDDGDGTGLALHYAGNSIFVEASTEHVRRAVIHFLFNPFYEASIDGSPTQVSSDPLGRMLIDLPAGKHQLRLRYDDPYFRIGVQLALLTLAVLVIGSILRRGMASRTPAGR